MSGGSIIGIVLGSATAIAFIWLIARVITRTIWTERVPHQSIYGDFPHLPNEMAASHMRGGAAHSDQRPAFTGQDRTSSDGGK